MKEYQPDNIDRLDTHYRLNLYHSSIKRMLQDKEKLIKTLSSEKNSDNVLQFGNVVQLLILQNQHAVLESALIFLNLIFPEFKPQTEQMNDRIKDSIPKSPNLDLK